MASCRYALRESNGNSSRHLKGRAGLLNFHHWYVGVWLFVLGLYSLGLTSVMVPLPAELVWFFVITISTSLLLGMLRLAPPYVIWRPEGEGPVGGTRWVPVLALVVGYALDWAYRGGVPALSSAGYQGYDPTAELQDSTGLPVVHVLVLASAVFYGSHLAFRWASRGQRGALRALLIVLVLMYLDESRISLTLVVFMVLLFRGARRSGVGNVARSPWRRWVSVALGFPILAYGFGIIGNLRLGSRWNDYTQLKILAGYPNPETPSLLDGFSWFYSYATSPLANLAYNVEMHSSGASLLALLGAFLPDSLTKWAFPPVGRGELIVEHLNASTGYRPFYGAFGIVGMYLAYVGAILLYHLWQVIARRLGDSGEFMAGVAVMFVVVFTFYNPLTNVLVSYLPVMGILAAWYGRRVALNAGRSEGLQPRVKSASSCSSRTAPRNAAVMPVTPGGAKQR